MQVHKLTQGSDEWLAFRAQHHGASEAAAMLGLSKTTSRTELLHVKHTGLGKEFSDYVQKNVLDYGHEVESLARPLIVKLIGEQLYPVTCSEGKLSASCDGLTVADDIAWENKQPNERICALVAAGQMPEEHMPQCQQVLMVTGADKLIFSVCDGTPENLLTMEVLPDPAWFARLRAGWAQFELDLAAYTPPAAAAVVVANPEQALPSVLVQVTGEIVVNHNFKAFETALRDFLEHRLIREPKSDQDFADLDVQIKAMKGAEAALEGSEVQMVAQVQPIDQAKKTKDMLLKLVRDNRLMAEKLLASEKERRRTEIVMNPATELRAHMATLNRELGAPYIPMPPVDFAAVIKGMRSLSSMEDAVATRLANAKIEANAVAATVRGNLKVLEELGAEFAFLFADKAQLVLKAADDFKAVATQRVDAHKRAEQERLEKERERIRTEEKAKLESEQTAAAQKLIDDAAAVAATAATQTAMQDQIVTGTGVIKTTVSQDAASASAVVVERIPAANVVPMRAAAPAPAAAPTTPASMKLGDINALLSPIQLTADGLAKLGFLSAATDKSAKLYHHRDLTNMCAALHDLLDKVQAKQAA